MWLKVLGIALAIWIVISVFGALFQLLVQALIIGAVIFVGAAAYSAVRARSARRSLRS